MAATKFYLPSSGTAPYTPAGVSSYFSAGTLGLSVLPMRTTKASTTLTDITSDFTSSGAGKRAIFQYVSPALASQTISGSWNFEITTQVPSSSAGEFYIMIVLRVMSPGGTVRGSEMQFTDSGYLLPSGGTGYTWNETGSFGSSITVTAGDYLLFEYGYSYFVNGSSPHKIDTWIGDNNANDIPANENEGTNVTYNPWISIANGVTFAPTYDATKMMSVLL